eukprot:NODE_3894_length_877_cov_26.830667_g3741_i0.p1 GENE.NODE_3894_length_877_cov_26.830667_g3741_i0~~NODE_3894_length_877_cov_26.830667_g3741_i0.p1  ORF type:complete len:283 (-),score=58.55 NODE_3894_length_877_cov_26.830667_g3741_i0:29-856(-)
MDRRFIADYSLFRVVKHLRLLGYECWCDAGFSADYLLFLARTKHLTVLTASKRLLQRLQRKKRTPSKEVYSDDEALEDPTDNSRIEYLYLPTWSSFEDTFQHIHSHFGLEYRPDKIFSLCLKCGTKITSLEHQQAKSRVPDAVFRLYTKFYDCQTCSKVYWGVDEGGEICNFRTLRTLKFIQSFFATDHTWAFHPFRVLPKTLKLRVLSFLPLIDINALALSARAYFDLCNTNCVWAPFVSHLMVPKDETEPPLLTPCPAKRVYLEWRKAAWSSF